MTIDAALPPLLRQIIPKTIRAREAREKHRLQHPNADVAGCRRCSGLRAAATTAAKPGGWQATFAGRSKGIHPRGWSDVENLRLTELLGQWTPAEIAEILNQEFHTNNGIVRTEYAVTNQIKRQKLSHMMQGFRMHEVEAIFQFDHRGMHRHWLEPGLLVPTRTFPGRGQANLNYVFTFEDLERFVREHHTAYDYRRIDPERVRRWAKQRAEVIEAARRLRIIGEQAWRADPYLTREEFATLMGWSDKSFLGWHRWAIKAKMVPFVRRRHSIRMGVAGDGECLVRAADALAIKACILEMQTANRASAQKKRIQAHGPSTPKGTKRGKSRVVRSMRCRNRACGASIIRTSQPFPLHCPTCKRIAWSKKMLPNLVLKQGSNGTIFVVGGY